jgi:hypothetical protein
MTRGKKSSHAARSFVINPILEAEGRPNTHLLNFMISVDQRLPQMMAYHNRDVMFERSMKCNWNFSRGKGKWTVNEFDFLIDGSIDFVVDRVPRLPTWTPRGTARYRGSTLHLKTLRCVVLHFDT